MSLSIDGHSLTPTLVVQVAYAEPDESTAVRLSDAACGPVAASRAVVDAVLASGRTVYGVNTGFGAMSSVTISTDQLDQLQVNLVRSHAIGTGEELSTPVVRAMMLLRANTLAKGLSGVRPVIIETLLAMLNRGVYPVIPAQGSLGASGDLAPLAHMTEVLIGEGKAVYQGEVLSGAEAMRRAGVEPVTLKAKEGLALLNGTQMMTAIGTLTLLEAEALCEIADLAGAMTVEAVKGSHKPFDVRIAEARPHGGHVESARNIRELLVDSQIVQAHADCLKVQDAYSLRCIPQVHGAVRDQVRAAREALEIEINAATDNPLVFPNGDIISQGNFHGEPVAMVMDMLAIAVAELGSIAERRMDKLMNPVFSDLPAFLVAHEGLNSGMMIMHYTAASLVSESKVLAHPACVDSIPTSNDKEDHVSMGSIAARQAAAILAHTRWILAAELIAAAQGLEYRGGLRPGVGVLRAYECIRAHVPPLEADRSLAGDVDTVVNLIRTGQLWQAVSKERASL